METQSIGGWFSTIIYSKVQIVQSMRRALFKFDVTNLINYVFPIYNFGKIPTNHINISCWIVRWGPPVLFDCVDEQCLYIFQSKFNLLGEIFTVFRTISTFQKLNQNFSYYINLAFQSFTNLHFDQNLKWCNHTIPQTRSAAKTRSLLFRAFTSF